MPVSDKDSGKPRRWSGYVCPDCRFVFRLPSDHDGDGIICPSCRRMLRIPGEGDETAPLMAPLQKIGFAEEGQDPRGEKRTRSTRKKKQKEAETPDWDASSGKWRSSRSKGKPTFRIVAAWLGVAVVALAGVFIFVQAGEEKGPKAHNAPDEIQDQFDELVKVPLILPDEALLDPVVLPKVMERSEADFLNLAQPIAEKFLSAKRIEDILPLVHNPDGVAAKIRAHHPKGLIEPVTMVKFNSAGRVSYKDSFAAVSITTSDFEQKQLAFIESDEGLKVDWESWAGWCEIPWAEIIAKKPDKPVLVRAMLKWVDYYNFSFTDESKWRSFRLSSPDEEHMIYGYVARNSLLDQQIRPREQETTVAVTVKIHFPENGEAANQFVIDEYVADGWVISGDKKE